MLLAGSTRYLSIHEAEGGWLVTAHPPYPSKLDIFTCVSFTWGMLPDQFPIQQPFSLGSVSWPKPRLPLTVLNPAPCILASKPSKVQYRQVYDHK